MGKYPKSEAIFRSYFGDERFIKGREIHPHFKDFVKIEEPDIMIYKPDYSEIRFVECKRQGTRDKLRDSQIRGLALLKLLYECPVEIFEIVEEGKAEPGIIERLVWEF